MRFNDGPNIKLVDKIKCKCLYISQQKKSNLYRQLYVYWGIPKKVKLKIIILTKQIYGKDCKSVLKAVKSNI